MALPVFPLPQVCPPQTTTSRPQPLPWSTPTTCPSSWVRERRIADEIVVDAYGEEEQALGWYYYLEQRLAFPFKTKCISKKRISPLKHGEVVEVTGMAPEDDCMHEMFIIVRWCGRTFGVPLAQLEGVSMDDQTREAIEDWHYWVARGYQF